MLSKAKKKKHLMIAISCLRQEGEKRPIFSPDVPTKKELELIKKGLKNGNIDEELLKKLFPMSYNGVTKYGFFEYFFYVHNKLINKLERYTHDKRLVEWCLAYPAKIVSKTNSKWVVKRIDDKKITTDSEAYPGIIIENELKIGDLIILHRNKIHMILSEKEFETALKYYNKYLREKETK
ncbi:MAG: hypothetical protein GTN40_04765 [Candidatus Aenigmarchaeota archaeon]|nr:hypothetical protein [Candidatus Aenigmarchaeota archaeon]